MVYLAFLYPFGHILTLRSIEVINPFLDLPNLSFVFEDVILILSRLPNFNEMSKIV